MKGEKGGAMKTRFIVSFLIVGLFAFWGCEDKDAAADSAANLEIINILDAMDVHLEANECSDANETFQVFQNFGEPDVVATAVCSSYFELSDDEFERYWNFVESNGDVTSAESCDILSGISTTVRTGLENNCFIFTFGKFIISRLSHHNFFHLRTGGFSTNNCVRIFV